MDDQGFLAVKDRAEAYRVLADAYDQALLEAHDAGHGTPEALAYLRRANDLAADVMSVLDDYQAAVHELMHRLLPVRPSGGTGVTGFAVRTGRGTRSRP